MQLQFNKRDTAAGGTTLFDKTFKGNNTVDPSVGRGIFFSMDRQRKRNEYLFCSCVANNNTYYYQIGDVVQHLLRSS